MKSLPAAPTVRLSNGVEMPQFGLGTWPMNDAEAAVAVAQAIRIGYRMIDTAENYRNERGVGEGVRQSGVPRQELFVVTKFNRQWHSVEGAAQACDASLQRLGLDYIDLLLIHWPNPDQDRFLEAYQGMVRLLQAGKVRAIGTSNFKPAHLKKLFDHGLTPMLNQIQQDPWHRREDLVALHKAHGIVTESWRPLGNGNAMLADPAIVAAAQAHGRTPAQIALRWQVQSGFVTAAKSADAERQAQNLDIFGFSLSEAEMAALNQLDRPDADMLDADRFGH